MDSPAGDCEPAAPFRFEPFQMACGAISESQARATSAARAPNPPSISRHCVLLCDEAEKPANAKDSFR
jgi:hypothetical protein